MRIRLAKPNPRVVRPLETERFTLRPLGLVQSIGIINIWRRDPDILSGLMNTTRPQSLLHWLRYGPTPDNHRRFAFAIVPHGATTPIGVHFVRYTDYRSAANTVGIHDREWWGKNVVVEVRARLMNHFFQQAGIERFTGRVRSRNTASIFTYKRLGYAHVGTAHRSRRDPETGEATDQLFFEALKEDWQQGPHWRLYA